MAKEGERGKRSDERGEAGGRRGRRREEDGSLAPPRPYETSTKGDLRGLAVFGFTSFLYSRDRPAGRIRERRPGMGIAWSLTSYYYTPYMAIRHTSRRRIARSWRETGLGLRPGFDDIVYFQDTCSWLNSIERVDLRTVGSLRDRQYLRINRSSC